MNFVKTNIKDAIIIEPDIYKDRRGFFLESWNKKHFNNLMKLKISFVQDNISCSTKGVLRGLHYQLIKPQGKLINVIHGEILDVVVDLRKFSPTFGKHLKINLSSENFKQIWVPPGCAHGFLVLSQMAIFSYKVSEYYSPKNEYCINWNDPDLNIDWQLNGSFPIISEKDLNGMSFKNAPIYE